MRRARVWRILASAHCSEQRCSDRCLVQAPSRKSHRDRDRLNQTGSGQTDRGNGFGRRGRGPGVGDPGNEHRTDASIVDARSGSKRANSSVGTDLDEHPVFIDRNGSFAVGPGRRPELCRCNTFGDRCINQCMSDLPVMIGQLRKL